MALLLLSPSAALLFIPQVLGQLEDALREAGTSKDHLLSVTWLLKDLPYGKDPISDVWNRWVNPRALPALTMQERSVCTCQQELLVFSPCCLPACPHQPMPREPCMARLQPVPGHSVA